MTILLLPSSSSDGDRSRSELLNKRSAEELAYMKQKSKELEIEMNALNQEKQVHFETMNSTLVTTALHRIALHCIKHFSFIVNSTSSAETGDRQSRVSIASGFYKACTRSGRIAIEG
jgi:hypothetical protein